VFLFLQVISYIKPDLRLFQAMAHLMSSPLCSHVLSPKTQDFSLSDITNQDFVPYIKQVRNFCSKNMTDLYYERSKIKGSATVHWNGKFTPLGAALNLPMLNFSTILYIIIVHGTVDLGYFLGNFWQHL
jgi:hypothetical protein